MAEAATNDLTGALGFAAPTTGQVAATGWSHNSAGLPTTQVLRVNDIETNRWTLKYNSLGDVISITDATNGRTATMTQYNAHGQMLTGTTDTGVSIGLSYSPRGAMTAQVRDGQALGFAYNPMGNLVQVRTPDGQAIDYVLDAYQRIIDIKLNGVSLTPQMLAQGRYPDGLTQAQLLKAKQWLIAGVEALMRQAHAQAVVVPGWRPTPPTFDPRTDMLMVPMTDGEKRIRALVEAITKMCTCDRNGGYTKPTFTASTYAHVFSGGHTQPMFSGQSYFLPTEKVGQALVDEVIAKASVVRNEGTRDVYDVDMGRVIGNSRQGPTQRVRLVVEKDACSSRWRFNEVVTLYPIN